MRSRRGFAAAAVALIAAVPLVTRASSSIDWVLTTLEVPAASPAPTPAADAGGGSFGVIGGSQVTEAAIEGVAHATGGGPVTIGVGFAAGSFASVDAFDTGTGGIHLRTTDDMGSVDIEVTPAGEGTFTFSISVGASAAPQTTMALLVFLPNAVIERYGVKSSTATKTTSGSGSTAILAAAPGMGGVAADVSFAAAGASTLARTVTKGLVGGPAVDACNRCTLDWATPDGRDGSNTITSPYIRGLPLPLPVPLFGFGEGDFVFAGPAGDWSWSWTGVGVRLDGSPAVVAAYAPIGDAWTLFRQTESRIEPSPPAPARKAPARVEGTKQSRGALAATGVGTPAWMGWALILLAVPIGVGLRRPS